MRKFLSIFTSSYLESEIVQRHLTTERLFIMLILSWKDGELQIVEFRQKEMQIRAMGSSVPSIHYGIDAFSVSREKISYPSEKYTIVSWRLLCLRYLQQISEHGSKDKRFVLVQQYLKGKVVGPRNAKAFLNDETSNGPRVFLGLIQIYSDRTATKMKRCAFIMEQFILGI